MCFLVAFVRKLKLIAAVGGVVVAMMKCAVSDDCRAVSCCCHGLQRIQGQPDGRQQSS